MSDAGISGSDPLARVARHMRLNYDVDMGDIEPSEVAGYWRDREPQLHPGHPLHGCLGCAGPFRATYPYFDPPRDPRGRFACRTRTWAELRVRAGASRCQPQR